MKPNTLTVHEIFEKERQYTVPLFQRAYVWNREDQWEPLWEDIKRQATGYLRGADQNDRLANSHFLGAVVFNVAKVFGRGIARSDVIDGQQRLTTLQIFLAALRDCATTVDEETAATLSRLTSNPGQDKASEERFKVWPTNADRDVYKGVMDARSTEKVADKFGTAPDGSWTTMPKLAQAYTYFHIAIAQFVEGDQSEEDEDVDSAADAEASASDRLYAILHALKTTVQLVIIELEEPDDPQVIFETLNARGQPLLPSDLIRNTVFFEASTNKEDIDSLYRNYWRQFDERRVERDSRGEDRFWHQVERQGRLTRPRIDLFVFHDLTMRTEKDLNIGHLFREFREWYRDSEITTEDYLASLKRHSDHFVSLIVPTGQDRISTFARRVRSLDTSTVYPILLFLMDLEPEQLGLDARDQIIMDLESFLVRRFVCQMTTKNYNRFFLSLLRKLKAANSAGDDLVHAARVELMRSDEPTAVWPSDPQFLQGWLNNPVYVKTRPDRSAMLLQALNDSLRTPKSETIVLPEELTVEHLLPRTWQNNYPLPDDMPLKGDETPEQCRARLLHTIGNLTLLTQPLNSDVSNGPFRQKAEKIKELSDLRINAPFRKPKFDSWNEHDILRRGKELFKQTTSIWPHPASAEENASDNH